MQVETMLEAVTVYNIFLPVQGHVLIASCAVYDIFLCFNLMHNIWFYGYHSVDEFDINSHKYYQQSHLLLYCSINANNGTNATCTVT